MSTGCDGSDPRGGSGGAAQDAPAKDGTRRLLEFVSVRGAWPPRVDKAAGLISGVKVLGLASANGREYSPEALRQAIGLYEGTPVNVDHVQGQRRSYRDRIGRLERVALREDGIYADLRVNTSHALAEQLFWDAEHAPENVGLSHDARGKTAVRGGKLIVEAIESVRSVDLVAEPAATHGLFEGVDPDAEPSRREPSMSDTLKNLTVADLRAQRADLLEAISAEAARPHAEKAADLEKRLAAAEGELATLRRRETIGKMLREAKIDADQVPGSLRESLETAAEEKLPKLVEDIGKMLADRKPGQKPTSAAPTGGAVDRFEDRVAAWAK